MSPAAPPPDCSLPPRPAWRAWTSAGWRNFPTAAACPTKSSCSAASATPMTTRFGLPAPVWWRWGNWETRRRGQRRPGRSRRLSIPGRQPFCGWTCRPGERSPWRTRWRWLIAIDCPSSWMRPPRCLPEKTCNASWPPEPTWWPSREARPWAARRLRGSWWAAGTWSIRWPCSTRTWTSGPRPGCCATAFWNRAGCPARPCRESGGRSRWARRKSPAWWRP